MMFMNRNWLWIILVLFFSTGAAAHDSGIPHLAHVATTANTFWLFTFVVGVVLVVRFVMCCRLLEKSG